MEPPHERAAGYLQMTWTPTDQVIMEHLLLEGQPTPKAKPKAPASPESWPTQVAGASSSSSDTDAEKSANSGSPTQPKKHKNDEDRRARHRAVQRRFVQRKKEAFQRAKRLLQELEAKYRFLRISAEERNLRHEQSVLHAHRVALASSVPSAPAAPAHVNPVEELITTQLELVREFYEPLSSEECKAIQFSNQREYEVSMTLDESYLTSGLTIMGWHDHRKMGNESVKLALSKEFPNIRALDLINMTWGTLSSPHTYARFFSPALTIKMQVLQTVDHDTIVIHRVLYHPQTQRASNSLELLWRTKIGAEYVIFDASLQNNAAQQCLGESYNWTQMTTSMAFGPTSADGCLFRHGGWLRRFAVSSVRYWLMEMFFMALRFESAMVAPVFALPPHESSDLDPASIDVAL